MGKSAEHTERKPTELKTIRASSLNRGSACPGSVGLCKDSAPSEAMERGTRMHSLIEGWLNTGEIDPDIKTFASWFSAAFSYLSSSGCLAESEASRELGGGWFVTGHLDAIWPEESVIMDWKTGTRFSLPDMGDDLQMAAYACISGLRTPITVHRVMVDELRYDTLVLGEEDLDFFWNETKRVCRGIAGPDPGFVTGPHCGHCRANAKCEKLQAVSKPALVPWDGAHLDHSRALMLARAVGPAASILKKANEAIAGYIKDTGPIYDPDSGKSYREYEVNWDSIQDEAGIIDLAMGEHPDIDQRDFLKVTKTSAQKVVAAHGGDVKAFLAKARGKGLIRQVKQTRKGWK